MPKKNSVYIKVLIPVIVVMLAQTLLISAVLFAKWALAADAADSALLIPAKMLVEGLAYSSAIAIAVGTVLLAITIRVVTKPLILLVNQLTSNAPDATIVTEGTGIYEVELLCETINSVQDKRRHVEAELREERERYLIALESVADTFMEYDIHSDHLTLYHFLTQQQPPTLTSSMTEHLSDAVSQGRICHPDDIEALLGFMHSRSSGSMELRVKSRVFSHIGALEEDCGYYWILLKTSCIYGEDGEVKKLTCVARDITSEKLRESERIEAMQNDSTTGFYNRNYGIGIISSRIIAAKSSGRVFALCLVHVENFHMFQAYYGRVFTEVMLMYISRRLGYERGGRNVAVRFTDHEFLLYFEEDRHRVGKLLSKMRAPLRHMYMGDNEELRLDLKFGVSLASDGNSYTQLFEKAHLAMMSAKAADEESIAYYDRLPPGVSCEKYVYMDNQPKTPISLSQDNMTTLAFDLFEHTTDIRSVIRVLLALIGEVFSLCQIMICSYEADFSASQVTYQWNSPNVPRRSTNIAQASKEDVGALLDMAGEGGCIRFNTERQGGDSSRIRRLLGILPGERTSLYGSILYENGINIGWILYKSSNSDREWDSLQTHTLDSISNIISTHISIDRSNFASRAKSEFLSRMSHEIRTPMNALIGMTGIAQRSMGDPARVSDCLEKIGYSAQHLLELINDVLDMSRIESGKLLIESEIFLLSEFANELEMIMRPQIEGKKISLDVQLDIVHDSVAGDEHRLRQVMVNFLSNAYKFTGEGGSITLGIIELSHGDGYGAFRFFVKDTGIGIKREDQRSIFKSFEQVRDNRHQSEQYAGTGLGLAISSSIVSAMGSRIELESEPDKGSEFSFTLRLELAVSQTDMPHSAAGTAGQTVSFEGKRLLLAEDNEINIEIATYLLEDVGFVVEVARNGQEAVDKFMSSESGYYDAVLMDIQMPVMDGRAASRKIRAGTRPDAGAIPIIAMTADAFDEDIKRSIEAGMNGHISKPVDNNELYGLLARTLGN